jgi:hypothetical protein
MVSFMRRPVASLLLVLLLAGFALPMVQAQSAVPACCRRGGQHHCTAPSTADGFRSLADCCFYRHSGALTTHCNPALGRGSTVSVSSAIAPNVVALASSPVSHLLANANPQRGPPLS